MARCELTVFAALAITLAGATGASAQGESKPLQVPALSREIDRMIQKELDAKKIPTSPQATDAEFLRRAFLDLNGRIPTIQEAEAFLADADPAKRSKLIENLLASPRYGIHFANVWLNLFVDDDVVFSFAAPLKAEQIDRFHQWLKERFDANQPWDALVRDILTAEGEVEKNPQSLFFVLNGNVAATPEPSLITRSTAKLFLGQQLQCAECHDHPFRELKQNDFWGMATFFGRLSISKRGKNESGPAAVFDAPAGFIIKSNNIGNRAVLAEPAILVPGSAFKNVGRKVPARLLDGAAFELDMAQPFRPTLARWLTSPTNPWFARAAVNRTWAHLLGRGLIHPVDDLHEDNRPSHPELLELLAREFVRSGFDQKRLVQAIAQTHAYQRSTTPVSGNDLSEPLFARMPMRVPSPNMLLDSLCGAMETTEAQLFASERGKRRSDNPWEATPRIKFMDVFKTNERDSTAFDHGIPQMLRRLNDPVFSSGGGIVPRLLKEKRTPESIIEQLYLAALSRQPEPDELRESLAFVERQTESRAGYSRLLWTLLNRSEFFLNH